MRIRAKPTSEVHIPPEIEPYCRQRFVSEGKDYEVHGIWVPLGPPPMVLLQVEDDLEYTSWLPDILLDIIDPTIPNDWQCNVLRDERIDAFVLGPDFMVRDAESFVGMVEHEADQVDCFWQRIDLIEKARQEQRWLQELEEEQGGESG